MSRRFDLLFFFLFSLTSYCLAETANRDALEARVERAKQLLYSHSESADTLLSGVISAAGEQGREDLLMQAYRLSGIAAEVRGRYAAAMERYGRAESLAVKLDDRATIGNLLMLKGVIHYRLGNYERALDFYLEAKKALDRTGHPEQQAALLNNLAVLYRSLSLTEEALNTYQQAIALATLTGDSLRLASAYLNMAAFLVARNDIDAAERYTRQSLAIRRRSKGDYFLSPCFQTLAVIKLERNQPDSAVHYIRKALKGFSHFHQPDNLISVYTSAAHIKLVLGDLDSARMYSDSSLHYLQRFPNINEMIQTCEVRAEILEATGDLEGAVAMYKRQVELMDSVTEAKLQSRMLAFRLEEQIKAYRKTLEHSKDIQSELKAEGNLSEVFILLLVTALVSVMIILLLIYRAHTNRKKLLAQLSERNKRLKELIQLQERTLSVVGHDLRSPIASLISLFHVIGLEETEPEDLKEVIDHGKKSLENTLLSLDGLIAWAGSQAGEQQSHRESISVETIVHQTLALYRLMSNAKSIEIDASGEASLAVSVYEGDLGIVLRNLVNNALKFTQAGGRIRIHFERHGDMVRIEVEDNGTGMSDEELERIRQRTSGSKAGTEGEAGSGMGISLLHKTVSRNGGTLYYESAEGRGTRVIVELPLAVPATA